MPMPPPPFTTRCLDCGWKKTIAPRSDLLLLGHDWFERCPRCSSGQRLTRSTASPAAAWLARLQQRLG